MQGRSVLKLADPLFPLPSSALHSLRRMFASVVVLFNAEFFFGSVL